MMFSFSILVAALAVVADAATPLTTTSHSSTLAPTTTTTHSSVQSRPTWFNVIARNSGTKYDGKMLMGTDQGLANITFSNIPSDFYPSPNIYLSGTNQAPRLKGENGFETWAFYQGSNTNPSPGDGSSAWLVFGGDDFSLYGYQPVLCSAVPKSGGKFYLACSTKAADGKVNYRKAIINGNGDLSLLPLNSALPAGYSFVKLEIKPLPGSAPTSVPPCCP